MARVTSERRTKAELLEEIDSLEIVLADADATTEAERQNAEGWRLEVTRLEELLRRADGEIAFLRSIVHGLVPESLTGGGPVR